MNPLWILAAFLFGAIISRIGLPPLVGYLVAGFALSSVGVAGGELLESLADAGVTLLLFTIDFNTEKVEEHQKSGRRVFFGDAGDSDFWKRVEPSKSIVSLVIKSGDTILNLSCLQEDKVWCPPEL